MTTCTEREGELVAALELAAERLCDGCQQGWPIVAQGTIHHEPGPDRYVHCRAQEQRAALAPREEKDA